MSVSPTRQAVWYAVKYFVFIIILMAVAAVLSAVFQFVKVSTESRAAYNPGRQKIIVDAGHGGGDGGAVSDSGLLEKELNLELSLTLRDMLCAAGYDVIMTRSDDSMLTWEDAPSAKSGDLRARTEIASANPDALFVSIHMNKFPSASVHGVQLYYSPNHPASKSIASAIRDGVRAQLQPWNERPLKEAGSNIYVLDRIRSPAVLVECGFLSNAGEAAMLSHAEYRQALALVICSSLLDYLDKAG